MENKKDPIVEAREEEEKRKQMLKFSEVAATVQDQVKVGVNNIISNVFDKINGLDKEIIKEHGAGLELLALSYLMDISAGTTLGVVKEYYPDRIELAVEPLANVLKQYGFKVEKEKEKENESRIITRV